MSWLLTTVLNWVAGKILAFLTAIVKVFERRQEIIDREKKSVEPLKNADPTDGKAIDRAADDALDHF